MAEKAEGRAGEGGAGEQHPARALGRRLEAARRRRGWTYEQMEAHTGVPRSTLQYLVRRRRRALDFHELKALVDRLGERWDGEWERLWRRTVDADTECQRLAAACAEPQPASPKAAWPGPGHELPTPRQLPLDTSRFSGRSAALAQVSAALDPESAEPPSTIVAIGGLGGVGKTTLALRWAHRNADLFPDGQLFADLRGFDPGRPPVPAETVMRSFLDALGVPASGLPADPEALTALYRSTLAGRRMLVVLDNARDAAHAAPLVPGSPTCRVVVTGRERLNGLVVTHGARLLVLDTLDHGEAMTLLAGHLGAERVTAEHAAAGELVSACAGLPLAVAIVASRAAANPDVPLADLAGQLRTAANRLDCLDAGASASLSAVLSSSYRLLDAGAARLFRLLGAAPSGSIGTEAGASLAGEGIPVTARLLRSLEDSTLLRRCADDRFVMHDLVRMYAMDRAAHDEPAPSRKAALYRLADHYLHTAVAGDRLLAPQRNPVAIAPPARDCLPVPLADAAAALEWFGREQPNLMAMQQLAVELGWHDLVWQLAWATDNFHYRRGHIHHHVTAWRRGLDATRASGDSTSQMLAYRRLGAVCGRAGDPDEALEYLRLGLDLATQSNDTESQAAFHQDLAVALGQRQQHEQALRSSIRAVQLYRSVGNVHCEAVVLNNVGWYYAQTGHYDRARTHCERALTLHEQRGDDENRAAALDSLGFIATADGRHTEAIEHYQAALAAYRTIEHPYNQANALSGMAETCAAAGQVARARAAWTEALDLYRAQRRMAEVERVERRLAAVGRHD